MKVARPPASVAKSARWLRASITCSTVFWRVGEPAACLEDHLTALPNRARFHERLRSALAAAQPSRRPLAVLVLDLTASNTLTTRWVIRWVTVC